MCDEWGGIILAEEKMLTEEEAIIIKDLLKECLESYQTKGETVTDKDWLKDVFMEKINGITEKRALNDAEAIVETVDSISKNLYEIEQVGQQGISKESWLANHIQQDMEVNATVGQQEDLSLFDDSIYRQNMIMAGQTVEKYTENDISIVEDMTEGGYTSYQLKEMALDIGKNASAYGIQSAASTVGTLLAAKIMEGENIKVNQIIQEAFQSGVDSSMQIVASGALEIASKNQLLQCFPETTPVEIIASVSSIGIEGAKILARVASGEITFTKAIEQFGRLGISVVKNLWTIAKNTSVKEVVKRFLPFLGPKFAIIAETVGTVMSFMGGTEFGKLIVDTKIKVASAAKAVAKTAVQGLQKARQFVSNGIKKAKKALSKIFS